MESRECSESEPESTQRTSLDLSLVEHVLITIHYIIFILCYFAIIILCKTFNKVPFVNMN